MTTQEIFMQYVLPGILGVLGTAITAYAGWAKTKIGKAQAERIKANAEEAKNNAALAALSFASTLIVDLVNAAFQKFIKGARKSLAENGEFEDYKQVLEDTKKRVLDEAKDQVMDRLLSSGAASTADHAVKIIDRQIESAVAGGKVARGEVAPKRLDPPQS